ncbi:hypothetical protein M434DRAFT_36476 [Hypoxylon sp. CO27-5]|nr:hypothetical protein M434DRAFT_36476 [Hypoxylon sp. CO27-5]
MDVDALVPNDPRVEHKFLSVGDYTYHFLLANPEGEVKDTIVLAHGWPDLGMGWRYQVPYLVSLGLKVIVPDMLGYGQTSAPESPDEYTMKKMASHIATIIKANANQPVILGGHDWGAALVWKVTMYYPDLIRATFGFCGPYLLAPPDVTPLEEIFRDYPNFRYQLSIVAGAVEAAIGDSPEKLASFVNGALDGTTPEGEPLFDPQNGIHTNRLTRIGASPLLDQTMLDYYVQEHSRHGLRGPCNWYRAHELNSIDELVFFKDHADFKFKIPAMIIMAKNDEYVPPSLADGMENYFSAGLKKGVIDSKHWVIIEKPEESNKYIGDFIASVLGEKLLPRA